MNLFTAVYPPLQRCILLSFSVLNSAQLFSILVRDFILVETLLEARTYEQEGNGPIYLRRQGL